LYNIKKAGINVKMIESQTVYHQWHESAWEGLDRPQNDKLFHALIK
jgi:hypothetical protein